LSRQIDGAIEKGVALRIGARGAPFAESIRTRGAAPYDEETVNRFLRACDGSSEQLAAVYSDFGRRDAKCLDSMSGISEEALIQAAEDIDLFTAMGINPLSDSYPYRHSLHVAMVAMSVGAFMGWDKHALLDLGLGCLIHDVGMQHLDPSLYQEERVLTVAEYMEVQKHPLCTLILIEDHLDKVPPASRMIAYQMHERCDGSGYPRGTTAAQIHPLAKIAAVADVFVALVSHRPHRPAMMPYYAMKTILHEVKRGVFDADVVRALLHAVSLFPLGSYVALNDGRIGRVIRANERRYDRPVIEVSHSETDSTRPILVDLSRRTDLRVVTVLAASHRRVNQ
jgi:HD-GYP domain-containing protein (c-di-GMP phosphodiesterase class II)